MPGRVQSKSGSVVGGTAVTVTLDNPTTTGNALLVIYSCFYSTHPHGSITDNSGSTFGGAPDVTLSFQGTLSISSAFNITGRSGHAVTVPMDPTQVADYFIVTVIEVAGLASAGLDKTHTSLLGNYTSGATATTTQADEYLVGAHSIDNLSADGSVPATGWTKVIHRTDGSFHRQLVQDRVVAATGAYASSGTGDAFDQNVIATYKIAASAGLTLTADPGTFAQTGTPAVLRACRALPAAGGAYGYTGTPAGLRRGYTLTATGGLFAQSGTDAVLRAARAFPASGGSYGYTGTPAVLRAARRLLAASGNYTWTGTAAQLTYSNGAPTYVFMADGGSFTLTGTPATLRYAREFIADGGTFGLTGTAAALRIARALHADPGTYGWIGTNAVLTYGQSGAANRDPVTTTFQIRRQVGSTFQVRRLVEDAVLAAADDGDIQAG